MFLMIFPLGYQLSLIRRGTLSYFEAFTVVILTYILRRGRHYYEPAACIPKTVRSHYQADA